MAASTPAAELSLLNQISLAEANLTRITMAAQDDGTRAEFPLHVTATRVLGVKFPFIEQKRVSRSMLGRGFSIASTSITIDEVASAFENEVEAIIELAETELHLIRLAEEVQRTSRRLNVLEHYLIPRLKAECDFIQMVLDERERADHCRLKLVIRVLERRREIA